ncbi:Transmembrane protein C15orf27 [Lonchura striata]|uniref:Transmembrane protein C15orf27 n=1 Tax=Lonchura striata TaxID=40157 RepID=A0A218UD74_9PASE|nr:Transmembrane protein C15orf27 [Lonchura striata domestica]
MLRPTIEGSVSEVEIISQQVEEETKSIAPVQLVNFAYRDLPLAALDLSVAGSQLLPNLDEEYQREGSAAGLGKLQLFELQGSGTCLCLDKTGWLLQAASLHILVGQHNCPHSAVPGYSVHSPCFENLKCQANILSELSEVSQYRNVAEHCDERYDTEKEELGDEKNQDGLYASEVHTTAIPITNTPKRKKICIPHLVLKGVPLGWQELAYLTLTLPFVQCLELRAKVGMLCGTPTPNPALNVCQVDFQSLLTCADSQQQSGNENICVSFQPLELLTPINTILRIVVLGIWDYIENKIEVFDGAIIILSLAPMVASTVANGPSSPWDAISLIITLRIWRVKRIIDVKVEMEMMIQQYEKAKVIQDEQLERLTQICQEQGFEIRQLRAHLAQQDLDLAAEREAALQVPHVLNKQSSKRYKVVATEDSDDEATENITELRPAREDDMNNYVSRYYSEPSSGECCFKTQTYVALDSGVPEAAIGVTTAAIDVHRPNISSELFTVDAPLRLGSTGTSASLTSGSASRSTVSSGTRGCSESSQTLGSSPDCSTACEEPRQRAAQAAVQELLSSLSQEACLAQKGLDPVNLKLPSPAGSVGASPDLGHRLSVYNRRNQDSLDVFQLKPLLDCPQGAPVIEEKYGVLGPPEPRLGRVPEA